MNYQYVKAFMAVARELNFTKAAHELGLTQAAVSRQIKLFEAELGEQLLLRSPQQVLLTARGLKLAQLWEQFEAKIQSDFYETKNRVLRIGVIEGVLKTLLQNDVIQKLSADFDIEISLDKTQVLKERLMTGEIDLVLCAENLSSGIIHSRTLFKEKLVLVSAQKIPDFKNMKHLRELLRPLTLVSYSKSDPILELLHEKQRYIQVNSLNSIIELLSHGNAVALLPEHALPAHHSLYTYSWKKASSPIFLCTLNYEQRPLAVEQLLQIFEQLS